MNSRVSIPLNVMFSPVAYLTEAQVCAEMRDVAANIGAELDYLITLGRERILRMSFATLVAAVVSLKHVGFGEEREWRVIYSPKRSPSLLVESSNEIIEGVPQAVYKLPLDEIASSDIAEPDLDPGPTVWSGRTTAGRRHEG
jgi:hypothetical protein